MKQIDLYVNNKYDEESHYKVQVAETKEDRLKGLSNIDSLPIDEGMLFVYDKPMHVSFWMKDTKIPLKMVFINEDQEVIKVAEGKPNDETPIACRNTMYVLEVNKDEDISVGDDVEFDLDEDIDPEFDIDAEENEMVLLDDDGNVQMRMEGNERVVSRKHTKVLIRKAKECKKWEKRNRTKFRRCIEALGRYLFYVVDKQNHQKKEYV